MDGFSLMRSECAILTPHNAFDAREALEQIPITSAEDFRAYFRGNPQNVVAGKP